MQSLPPLYQKALQLSRDWKSNVLELAYTLLALQRESPAHFAEWVARPDVSRRRAYYLVAIARAYEQMPMDRGRLERLGWTKMKEMAKHIHDGNAEELIATAENSTVIGLRQYLAGAKQGIEGYTVVMQLTGQQHRDFRKALLLNGAVETASSASRLPETPR